jgi:hypothetical protein
MNWQKLYYSLSKKRNLHASKQSSQRLTPQPGQFQRPAVVNPITRLSIRDKVWLSVGVLFGIVYIFSALVTIHAGAQQTSATQDVSATITSSSPTTSTPTQTTTILNPPSISTGKQPQTATPTPIPFNPLPTACPGVNCNPWGYNFIPGNLIYNPPAGFCNYFACVTNFYKPHPGYIIECNDGLYTQSGGLRGACLPHGGVLRPLYAH